MNPPKEEPTAGVGPEVGFANSDFLRMLLGRELAAGEYLWVTGFAGNPGNKKEARWTGARYPVDNVDSLTPTNNNYFSVALFGPDAKGRKQEHSLGVFVVMLDDVQHLEALPLLPTAIVETSKGKVQVHFALDELMGPEVAEPFHKRLGRLGYLGTDASGHNSIRYARFPVGANGKTDPPTPCRLLEWHPERRYGIDEIIGAFPDLHPHVSPSATDAPVNTGRYRELITQVITGTSYHDALRDLIWIELKNGLPDPLIVERNRALMEQQQVRDDRWQGRYDDIPRMVREGRDKIGEQPASETDVSLPSQSDSGTDLAEGQTPDIEWIIPGYLPATGVLLLAGRSKGGKSTLTYQAVFCATSTLDFLGTPVANEAKVVLISKDDQNMNRVRRRFQRLIKDMPGADDPELVRRFKRNMLATYYEWDHGERAIAQLDLLKKKYPQVNLIAVDAWASISARTNNKTQTLFHGDYDEMKKMAKWAHANKVLLMPLIHTRKPQLGYVDPIDEVQGTTGVTAAVDDLLGLRRDPKRDPNVGATILSMRGRNLDAEDFVLRYHGAPKGTGGGGYFTLEGTLASAITGGGRQEEILGKLDGQGLKTQHEIAVMCNTVDANIVRAMTALVEKGRLEVVLEDGGKRYRLSGREQVEREQQRTMEEALGLRD